jgi:hypothetical protein
MHFKVNANGDTWDSLAGSCCEAAEALSNLETVLRRTRPHGRNYQTCLDPVAAHDADGILFRTAFEHLKWIRDNVIYNMRDTLIQDVYDDVS